MGQPRSLFVYFRPFHKMKPNLVYNLKKRRCCALDSNPGPQDERIVDAGETTELWRPKTKLLLLSWQYFLRPRTGTFIKMGL